MFTSWAIFDRWEVTTVYSGTGGTLSRVYELLSNSADALLGIYSFLANTSLNPTINADVNLLSDFIDGLDASRRDSIFQTVSVTVGPCRSLEGLQCLAQLKRRVKSSSGLGRQLKPIHENFWTWECSLSNIFSNKIGHVYHLRVQETFSQFLKTMLISKIQQSSINT